MTVDVTPPIILHLSDFGLGVDGELDLLAATEAEVVALFACEDLDSGIASTEWWLGSFPGATDMLEPTPVDFRLRSAAASVRRLVDFWTLILTTVNLTPALTLALTLTES